MSVKWKDPIHILKPGVNGFSKTGQNWQTIRKATLAKYDNVCNFCGGKYTRYLMCIELGNDHYGTCCKLCYMVKHLEISLDKLIICHSELSQVEIIRKTVELQCPSITTVDPNAKIIKLSPLEYSNLIRHDVKLPEQYKIFFKNVELEASTTEFSDSEDQLEQLTDDIPIEYHHFSKNELDILRKHFS